MFGFLDPLFFFICNLFYTFSAATKNDKRRKKIETHLDNTEKIVKNITEIIGAING